MPSRRGFLATLILAPLAKFVKTDDVDQNLPHVERVNLADWERPGCPHNPRGYP